jgi:hypothetical protein
LQDPQTASPNPFAIDLSWQPTFNPTNTYTLPAGASYAWPADIPLFARITPLQNPEGNAAPIWVQPQGVGQSSPFTTSTVNPLPLPTQIDLSGTAGGSPGNPLYVSSVAALLAPMELAIANPPVGNNGIFITSVTGKINMFRGSFVCGAEVNERQLYFIIVYGPTGVIQYPYIIGQTAQNCGFAGGIGTQNGILGSVMNFGLPNVILPAGSRIGVTVVGINPDDYLDDIDFVISAPS